MQTTSTEDNMKPQEGNFPSTPIINSLITRINSEDFQTGEAELDDIKSVRYKFTSRRFPALSYLSLKPLSDVQGITNKEAIITKQIRRWWVLNWNEGRKIIKLLPLKPRLSTKTWKSIAFSSFINLQDFVYKNIVDNVKYESEDTIWQTSESG
ncbi:hypothetical protein C2G38_2036657 [Gigaspora rosea]|uniref:Uncharacterized protein n=1 Tax=Gigaspora rosea TaxID=44941 RepID=A0A397V8F9_9GLOM|nr:hypothetical protein C2G38_2036657 [Gigaspora rosea]